MLAEYAVKYEAMVNIVLVVDLGDFFFGWLGQWLANESVRYPNPTSG